MFLIVENKIGVESHIFDKSNNLCLLEYINEVHMYISDIRMNNESYFPIHKFYLNLNYNSRTLHFSPISTLLIGLVSKINFASGFRYPSR